MASTLGFDLDDFNAVVSAATGTHAMRRLVFLALRAYNQLPRLERQMAAAAVTPTLLDFTLWKSTH